MRPRLLALISVAALVVILLMWASFSKKPSQPSQAAPLPATAPAQATTTTPSTAPTNIYAHNLMLRKGPSFRVYVRWLNGQLARSQRNVVPSFDDPDSFFLDIKTGVLRANIGDIGNFLNSGAVPNSPVKNIKLSGDGNQIKLDATVHKIIPLPIELTGTISSNPDGRIQIHITKLGLLKIPLKALLGDFHIKLADLFHPGNLPGVQVTGNDIFFDTTQLFPPPHIRGQLTTVHVVNPDLELIYGNAAQDVSRVEQWRNFLRLSDGTIDFGKLTMNHVDLIMIDISKDAWFDLDLANYQAQLVNGYTRMTPQAGLQIFMPDLRDVPAKAPQNVSIEWLKNRNLPPPADITSHH